MSLSAAFACAYLFFGAISWLTFSATDRSYRARFIQSFDQEPFLVFLALSVLKVLIFSVLYPVLLLVRAGMSLWQYIFLNRTAKSD